MGRNWAIAIGINIYENLSSLKYAKRDAEAIADWFGQDAKFDQVFLFTADSPAIEQTNPPIPTSPTYGHLRRFLRAQFENIERPLLKPEDNLWFFFAGHGLRHRDKDYLMLCDSDPGDVEHTAISVEYVTQRLRRSGADNVVLFLDACRDQGSRDGVGIGREQHQGVITFYSCTANQKSWEFDELQHGSFTYALLEGLRIQGEANCATVERLNQYLRHYVPRLNARYGKDAQNPYLKAEPPYKMYFILLEQSATLKDVEPLKYQASLAENESNLLLAEQLWIRILAVSRGDLDAIKAIQRIAVKRIVKPQSLTQEPASSTSESESANLPRGVEVETSENEIRREEQHQENLEQFAARREAEAIEQREQEKIRQQQQEEAERLRKREAAKYQQEQEEQRTRQQKEAERLQRKQEETERLQQQRKLQRRRRQEVITTSAPITRKQFLKWAGFGSAGLVTAFVISEIVKDQPSTDNLTESTKSPTPQSKPESKTTHISVDELDAFKFETVMVDQKGEIVERANKQAKFFKEDLGNSINLEMVSIPGGKFMMGSPEGKGQDSEKPQHEVTVQPFFMGKFQITQAQYQEVMNNNPSHFKGNDLPVEQVSWEDAVEFCQRISEKTGNKYRLPTEAEWEYACRAVTTTPFHFGETITTNLANYDGNNTFASEPQGEYRKQTTTVGSFTPNAFGLYDMHGNVWEWCQDNWHDNYENAPKDGSAWLSGSGSKKVIRGGSWNSLPIDCRSAARYFTYPEIAFNNAFGFRVVCMVPRIL
ncbi:SUMF1/EgtB/PvdO family nonheme iron enzyme [Xenococcus sp. PCC 7305]|uniref:SUMF1/EgtB/PvdO family nonheme iron enzyme n=1 Tax=Xenococcus sp. PCC 7305 TaxID=102125 RepID=UPI0005925D33